MHTAKKYVTDTAVNMQRALSHLPLAVVKPLPTTMQEISRYVEALLTDEEQRVCDMATD